MKLAVRLVFAMMAILVLAGAFFFGLVVLMVVMTVFFLLVLFLLWTNNVLEQVNLINPCQSYKYFHFPLS